MDAQVLGDVRAAELDDDRAALTRAALAVGRTEPVDGFQHALDKGGPVDEEVQVRTGRARLPDAVGQLDRALEVGGDLGRIASQVLGQDEARQGEVPDVGRRRGLQQLLHLRGRQRKVWGQARSQQLP